MGLWRSRPFAAALCLAVAAHALVLAQLASAAPDVRRGVEGGMRPVQLRFIPGELPSLPAPAAADTQAGPPPAAPALDVQPVAVPAAPAPVMPASQPLAAASAPSPLGMASGKDDAGQFLDYVPRSMLTRAPSPVGKVEVPFPKDVKGKVELAVRFSLYVDEEGVVRQVRIDTPDVPAVFEQAVRDTFMRARFQPGQIQDKRVRSMLRLEVSFDTVAAPN